MKEQPKKRGGPRPGSGRPKKDEGDKVVKCKISMTPAHHAATEGDRAGIIRRALDFYPWDVDFCIVGRVYSVWFEPSPYNETYTLKITFVGGAECFALRQEAHVIFGPGDTIKVSVFSGESTVEVLNPPSGDKQL